MQQIQAVCEVKSQRGGQRRRLPGQHDSSSAFSFVCIRVCHYQTHGRHADGAGEEHSGKEGHVELSYSTICGCGGGDRQWKSANARLLDIHC